MAPRRAFTAALTLALTVAAVPTAAHGDLLSRIGASRGKDRALSQRIGSDSTKIDRFEVRIDNLRGRLSQLQSRLDREQGELDALQTQLRTARGRLTTLKRRYAEDRRILADQLVSQYEAPHPDLVTVVLGARGFSELIETAHNLRRVADHNAQVVARVKRERAEVREQATHLTALTARQQKVTTRAIIQRDQLDELKMALIQKQSGVKASRASKQRRLDQLRTHRKSLEKQLADIQAHAAGLGSSGPGLPSTIPPFIPHGGSYGLFLSGGTNYTYGSEPAIAARLDIMGKALHLHLTGLSGYRSPAHSVAVGGFANDPHTRGEASDTPGLEAVPEATLNRYGLTRPFLAPSEANHVQLVGSSTRLR